MVKQGREEYIRLQQIVSNELTGNKDKKDLNLLTAMIVADI